MAGLKKKPFTCDLENNNKNITLQSQNRRMRQKRMDIQHNTHDQSLYWFGTGTYKRGSVYKVINTQWNIYL